MRLGLAPGGPGSISVRVEAILAHVPVYKNVQVHNHFLKKLH